jgi:hypothetical protein
MISKELFEQLDREVMSSLPAYTFARKRYERIKEAALNQEKTEELSKSQLTEKLTREVEGGKAITLSATNLTDFVNHLYE